MVISGVGMVTSVGHNFVDACAAIRAGIVRPYPWDEFLLVDEETQAPMPLTAHPIQGLTEGFYGLGLWVRLAQLCVNDLVVRLQAANDVPQTFWRRTALLAVTPDWNGERFGG